MGSRVTTYSGDRNTISEIMLPEKAKAQDVPRSVRQQQAATHAACSQFVYCIKGFLEVEETHEGGTVLVKVHVTCMMALVSLFGLTTSLGAKSLALAVPFIGGTDSNATFCGCGLERDRLRRTRICRAAANQGRKAHGN
jgi:hypothetical protein